MGVLVFGGLVLAGVVAFELLAWAGHKYILHGPAWGLHRSHHEGDGHGIEANDVVSLIFGAIAVVLFTVAGGEPNVAMAAAVAMTVYGLLYVIVHDGVVHGRFNLRWLPVRGYLKRLVQAHRLHHASPDRERSVAYGFLYAPPVRTLVGSVRAVHRETQASPKLRSTTSAARLTPPASRAS
jgi:beta-carotene 3-hydroxylase